MTTFIYTTSSKAKAENKAGFWTDQGATVHTAGPVDEIELTGDPAPKMIWQSGENKDWYVVVATQ